MPPQFYPIGIMPVAPQIPYDGHHHHSVSMAHPIPLPPPHLQNPSHFVAYPQDYAPPDRSHYNPHL
jgi:hypothetical protein